MRVFFNLDITFDSKNNIILKDTLKLDESGYHSSQMSTYASKNQKVMNK